MTEKILYFHPNNDFTGSTQVLANVLELVCHPVTVITNNQEEGCLSRLENIKIIPEYRLKWKNKPIPIMSTVVNKLCLFFMTLYYGMRYDAFYINTLKPYHAAIIGSLLRKKIYWHVHEKFLENTAATRFYEFIFNHTKAERIYVSNYLKAQYPDKKECQAKVVYNKLSQSFISKINIVPICERKIDTITMICTYSKMKGIYNLKEIAKSLTIYNFILIMSTTEEKIAEFKEEGIPSNLEVYPKQADIHPFLRRTDLMLNLSIPSLCVETFGMTILEAMAYGIPSVVPNIGGPTELIRNDENGYCVDVTDLNSVKAAILESLKFENYVRLSDGALRRYKKLCNG